QGDDVAIAHATMMANPRIAAVAFDILSPDRPGHHPRTEMKRVPSFIGCGHMIRLTAAREVGLYAPSPGDYAGEEKDLCLRLMDAGYEVVKLPGVHVWHDKTPLGRSISSQYESGICNDLTMTFRRTPLLILPFALVAKFGQHVLVSSRRGLLECCWRGWSRFARSLPEQWRTRKSVKL